MGGRKGEIPVKLTTLNTLIVTERQEFFCRCEGALYAFDSYGKLSSYHLRELEGKLSAIQPDIVIIDSMMNRQTSKLLDVVEGAGIHNSPALFVCAEDKTPEWERHFLQRGALYVFGREMDEHMVVECAIQLYYRYCSASQEEEMQPELIRLLRECCFEPRHKGYTCIFDSVCLVLQQPSFSQSLSKKIYPHVAEKQKTTVTRVEKNIRDAIRNAWERGGDQVMPLHLGCGGERAPSNGQLIYSLCETMRENMLKRDRVEVGSYATY